MRKSTGFFTAALCLWMCGLFFINTFGAEGGWQEETRGWNYVKEDGSIAKAQWLLIDGKWYYFDKDGTMVTGWKTMDNEAWFFLNSGELAAGWCYDGSEERWYYFDEDGTRKTGWFFYNGSWYYLNSRGQMVSDGYTTIDGERYYFYEDGRMAANKYVGTFYIGDNGLRDSSHDIRVEGKKDGMPADEKERITAAMANLPSGWVKHFLDHGWEILYYTDKEYFSAPDSDGEVYYVKYKLDTSYRKLKIIDPDCLLQGFGEYIGYVSGLYEDDSADGADLMMDQASVEDMIELPSYYSNDIRFYFGSLCKAYLELGGSYGIKERSPVIYDILTRILFENE